jgi:hypothetical protein
MEPREFSYGGMFVQRAPYAVASLCMLALIAASAWITVSAQDAHTRLTGWYSLAASIVLFIAIVLTPVFIRWALIVRIDSWGVSLPVRLRPNKKTGLPWEQIAEVRVLHTGKRDTVVLTPHNPAYLSPLMRRFGFFVLPPVNVSAGELKDAIEDYRREMQRP